LERRVKSGTTDVANDGRGEEETEEEDDEGRHFQAAA
jgi:hypothetical protein